MGQSTAYRTFAIFLPILFLALPPGCRVRPPIVSPAATAVLVDMEGIRHALPQAEADALAALIAATPDVDTPDHISLDPPYRVIVNGLDLALQNDELTLMHRRGTKRWKAPGVQARILASVQK